MRKLQDGAEVKELSAPVQLVVYTKCPEKYKLIDIIIKIKNVSNKYARILGIEIKENIIKKTFFSLKLFLRI